MTEPLRFWSVTSLNKEALGTGRPLVIHGKKTIAGIAYDKFKTLSAFVEDDDREGAIKWMLDAEWSGLKKAAARGTDLHHAAEKLALGEKPEVEEHIQPYLDQYVRFLEEHSPTFLMAEAPVYSPRYGYAGTCDGVIELQGKTVLFDIKTTAHGPDAGKSRPPFNEHVLQVCAYRHAEFVGLLAERVETNRGRYYIFNPEAHHEPMPETDGAVVLTVSPSDYYLTPVDTGDRVWVAFRAVIELARFQVETSKSVFGPLITAPQEVAA